MPRTFALSLVALVIGASVWAFQDPGAAPQMPQPGAEHKLLQRSVGTWEATVDMMGQTSKGTMTIELGPGGFTTLSHFNGSMMGGPFEGRGIDGYDASKKKFVSWWTDSMTAAPLLTEGSWDEKTQTMTMQGEMLDMSGTMQKHRFVTKYTGNDTIDFQIFGPGPDGKESGDFKIHYTRKK
jgi:hypothetical protein